jgi:hypothetical protein
MEQTFNAVEVLVERMKTHPEEFFEAGEKRGRWAFIYKDYFRDCLTESEKGRILESLRAVRRTEFDATVVKELLRDEQIERQELERQMKAEAQAQAMRTAATHGLLNNYQNPPAQNQMAGYGQALMKPSPFGAVPKGEGDPA